jgi:hypothetical protein
MEIGPTRKPRALVRVPHRALRWSLVGARRAGGPITNPLFFWVLEDKHDVNGGREVMEGKWNMDSDSKSNNCD